MVAGRNPRAYSPAGLTPACPAAERTSRVWRFCVDRADFRMQCLHLAARTGATAEGMIRAAKQFEDYVLGEPTPMEEFIERAKTMPLAGEDAKHIFRPYQGVNPEELP